MRVDVGRVLRPGLRDQVAALARVALVPGGQVALDELGGVAHDSFLSLRSGLGPSAFSVRIRRARRAGDYGAGNGPAEGGGGLPRGWLLKPPAGNLSAAGGGGAARAHPAARAPGRLL